MHRRARLLLPGLFLCLSVAHAGGEAQEYSFGIVPQQSATRLARLWGPILDHLSRESGLTLAFHTAPNIPTFERRLKAQRYDFAYMNPYHFTLYNEDPGYRAMGKAAGRRIKGILVVTRHSPIRGVEELDGATLAFPAPLAFAATLLSQSHMRQLGIRYQARYVSSHDSVYRSVAKGLYPAGGGIVRTLDNVDPAVRDELRILWTSRGYTPHAFAAAPGIDASVVAKVAEAMYAMAGSERGRALLGAIRIEGIEAARDSDWDDVRALNIEIRPR